MAIYVTLVGGFANQLAQFLAAARLANKHRTPVICDLSFLNSQSEHQGFTVRKYRLHRLVDAPKTCDGIPPGVEYLPFNSLDTRNPNVRIHGYFQSLRDIPTDHSEIIAIASIDLCEAATAVMYDPGEIPEVAIHVRRGDYVTNPSTNAFHGVLGVDYYKKALRALKVPSTSRVMYFTDDVDWVKENLIPEIPNPYDLAADYAVDECEEWEMMSLCPTIIMANSSFSWLAAVAAGDIEVAYPAKWFAGGGQPVEMFKPEWIKIED